MPRVFGTVGVGPGWPAMRTNRPLNIAVRNRERTVVDDMVVEPAYADLRVSSNGRFSADLEEGYWWFRIQYGNYKVERLLQVHAGETAAYEDLIEINPDSLDPVTTPELPTGPAGPPGPSAYDVAVADGFVGDEAAWLASLEGAQGEQGIQGETGDTGAQGETGPMGEVSEEMVDILLGNPDDIERTARRLDTGSTVTNSSGRFTFGLFRARKSRTITNLRLYCVSAGSAITRLKLALFTVDGAGLLTQVAVSANDTAAAANSALTRTIPGYAITEGQWYAIGIENAATTAPTFIGVAVGTVMVNAIEPVIAGITSGNSDMPASVARVAYAGSTSALLYAEAY